MSEDTIRISEIFGPTIQGEGALIGEPTVFVRTGGCDYRCSWCDTLYAVESRYRDDWMPTRTEDVFEKIEKLSGYTPLMVSLSGGNPAIQPLGALIDMGQEKGHRFALETQGSIAQDWFADLDVLTLSPKPPSSHMDTDWDKFDACIKAAQNKPDIVLKFVILDEDDYIYARETAEKYPDYPVYIQPCNHAPDKSNADLDGITERMLWLVEKVTNDRWFTVRVLPQLHVMLWGNKRGV